MIPTYNRPTALRRCITALGSLDYPHDRFEAVVVDDGSPEPAAGALADLDPPFQVCVLRQDNAGPASARNHGARVARGRYLAFTDDDCTPDADWLRQLESHLARGRGTLVGGRTVNALPDNPFSTASQDLITYLYEHANRELPTAGFFASNNIALWSADFADLGGFDEEFPLAAAEDRLFCDEWASSGRQLAYAPDAVVEHHHHLTFSTFWRQHLTYGRGAFDLRGRRTKSLEARHFQPFRFYLGLILSPWRNARGLEAVRGTALMLLMQLATTAGFARAWIGSRN